MNLDDLVGKRVAWVRYVRPFGLYGKMVWETKEKFEEQHGYLPIGGLCFVFEDGTSIILVPDNAVFLGNVIRVYRSKKEVSE